MKTFYITAVLNVLFCSFIIAMIDQHTNLHVTDKTLGAFVFSTIIDIPLIFTIPIALFCRNVSFALFLIATSTLASRLLLSSFILEGTEYIAYGILAQVVIGLLIHRCMANWKGWRIAELKVYSGYIYRKASIEPLDWVWRERVQNFLQSLTSIFDKVSLPIFLIGVIISLASSPSEFLYTFLSFYAAWVFYITCVVSPLTILETVLRFLFSASKSDSPKHIASKAMEKSSATLTEMGQTLSEKDIPNRTKTWVKTGFSTPPDAS